MVTTRPISPVIPGLSDLPSIDDLVARVEELDEGAPELAGVQVELVARMLDQDNAAWFYHMDPETLDMSDVWHCALGLSYANHPDRDSRSPFGYGRDRLNEAFDRYELWEAAVSGDNSLRQYWVDQANVRLVRLGRRPLPSVIPEEE